MQCNECKLLLWLIQQWTQCHIQWIKIESNNHECERVWNIHKQNLCMGSKTKAKKKTFLQTWKKKFQKIFFLIFFWTSKWSCRKIVCTRRSSVSIQAVLYWNIREYLLTGLQNLHWSSQETKCCCDFKFSTFDILARRSLRC